MANVKRMNKAAEKLARSNRHATNSVVDHFVDVQERNIHLARSFIESAARELRE